MIDSRWLSEGVLLIEMKDVSGKNCLSPSFVSELMKHIAAISCEAKVMILSGLPDVFCSGASLDTLQKIVVGEIVPGEIILPKVLLDIPIPVIAAMEGHATGGGFALGLCSDIVILSESSRYGCSFMNMGFTPGMGITRLLEHYMSPAIAHEMQYTGEFRKGKDLKGKTNFNYILPKDEVLAKAEHLAMGIAEKEYDAIRLLKKYLSLPRRKIFEETYTIESMMHELTFKKEFMNKFIGDNYVQ